MNEFSVSVVIGSLGDRATLKRAIDSCTSSHFPQDLVEVIVVINGTENRGNFDKLNEEYADAKNVRIVFTNRKGPGIARNIGMEEAKNEWVTILDDDDYFTKEVFSEAQKLADDDVNIIQMKCFDMKDGIVDDNTYINNTIRNIEARHRGTPVENYSEITSILGNNATKLYRKALWEQFTKISEELTHSEDVYFWAENFGNISGKFALFPADSFEGYIREVHGSLSRPDTDEKIQDFISDKFEMIGMMSDLYDRAKDSKHRAFILSQIRAQETYIKNNFWLSMPGHIIKTVKEHLKKFPNSKLKAVLFAESKGVVFSYYGIPEDDVSAYMSAKRLEEINEYLDEIVQWHLFKKDTSNIRSGDVPFNSLFASRFCYSINTVCGKKPLIAGIDFFAEKAISKTILLRTKYIYSRSMPPHGHMAAYEQKKYYPDAVWFAELSDPISMDTANKKKEKVGDKYEAVEQIVYEHADHIIFTNKNQMEYMLSYNCNPELNDIIVSKALIWPHPVMDESYTVAVNSDYYVEQDRINIAYFGAFYKGSRDHMNLLRFLENENATLHIFCPRYYGGGSRDDILRDAYSMGYDISNVRVNTGVSLFEMFNIASRMDYLYLEDTDFPGELNPYLPSKFADYKTACNASGTKIIAKVNSGSVLSMTNEAYLIKIPSLTGEFICGLTKQVTQHG